MENNDNRTRADYVNAAKRLIDQAARRRGIQTSSDIELWRDKTDAALDMQLAALCLQMANTITE